MLIATTIVVFTVLVVLWLGRQKSPAIKRLLDWVPSILFAYIIPAAFTHLFDLDMSTVALHGWSKTIIIPLAIIMVMSALSFKQLKIVGLRPILLFVAGSFVIAILAPLLVLLIGWLFPAQYDMIMGEQLWKGLVPIVGGWIGGSTSQLVLKELVGCPEGLFLAILVLDNILVNIWTILMFQAIKRSDGLNARLGIVDTIPDFVPDEVDINASNRGAMWMTLILSLGAVLLTVLFVKVFLWQVLLLSVLGLILGNLIPRWQHALVLKIGGVLIILIMAILGLKLNFSNFSLPLVIVVIAVVWLILHYVVMMLVAKALRLHMAWVPIASMANLGGISTAPAVTAAYNEEWMPHAILLAILSMVSGTWWGMLTILLFNSMA
jgi:uncharacterized membrane protein